MMVSSATVSEFMILSFKLVLLSQSVKKKRLKPALNTMLVLHFKTNRIYAAKDKKTLEILLK